jgi:hypothetical protein
LQAVQKQLQFIGALAELQSFVSRTNGFYRSWLRVSAVKHRFRPLIDLYRKAFKRIHASMENMKVGLHSLGFVGEGHNETLDKFFPGYQNVQRW